MKHITKITVPAKACVEGHPGIKDSIEGFLADPVGAIMLHLRKNCDGCDQA